MRGTRYPRGYLDLNGLPAPVCRTPSHGCKGATNLPMGVVSLQSRARLTRRISPCLRYCGKLHTN
jgi:hypothetical protein